MVYNPTRATTKTSQETQKRPMKFLEPTRKPKVIHTDTSVELGKSCEDLSWNHCTSTPHRSETNGIADGAVRRVKEGTSAVLLQSGLDEKWWADSMERCSYLRNIHDLLSDGKRHHMEGGSENHLTDQLFHLEQWSNITLLLPKTYRDFIDLVLKSCQENSWVMSCMRRYCRRHSRNGADGCI